jgi:hypothetical protein
MALLQNRSQRASFLVKHIGATGTASEAGHLRSVLGIRNVSLLLPFTAPGYGKTSSTPVGYTPGSAIFPPMKSGGMGVSIGYIGGGGSLANADLINALRLIVAALSGSGNVTDADCRPSLPAVAGLAGSGDISNAALGLIISALASLSGSGALTSDASGSISAIADLSGSGSIEAAIGALAGAIASLTGSGGVSAQPYATGTASATIRGYSDLTPEGIRDTVWNALLAQFQGDGTAGKALSTAGAGGVDLDALAAAVWSYATRSMTAAEREAIAAAVWNKTLP